MKKTYKAKRIDICFNAPFDFSCPYATEMNGEELENVAKIFSVEERFMYQEEGGGLIIKPEDFIIINEEILNNLQNYVKEDYYPLNYGIIYTVNNEIIEFNEETEEWEEE